MTSTQAFREEQRIVALAMAAALATTIFVLGAVAIANRSSAATPFALRLQSALRADLFVIVWLAAAIANVARLRFFSERDIAGSGTGAASDRVREAGAILQNTGEQAGLAVVTHLVVAACFAWSNAFVWALVSLFSVGRLLFWVGYGRGAKGRAFGFALTFYPSMLALIASAVAMVAGWAAP